MKKYNLKKTSAMIREIEKTRSKNNKNWMDLLRLACKYAPTKAKKVLKWSPKYGGQKGFKKGLERTIKWFRDPKNLKYYKPDIYNI